MELAYIAEQSTTIAIRIPDHISIIFPILSCYDAHLFINELRKKFHNDKTGVNRRNKEKDISFIESCRFMESSLDKLAWMIINVRTFGSFTCEMEFLSLWCTKVSIHINIGIVRRNLRRQSHQHRTSSDKQSDPAHFLKVLG